MVLPSVRTDAVRAYSSARGRSSASSRRRSEAPRAVGDDATYSAASGVACSSAGVSTARRARRAVETPADEQATPLAAEYVASSPTARGASLRRLLDALDLPRAELYARTASVRTEGSTIARALGYPADAVRVTSGGGQTAATNDPLVLLELPTSREEVRDTHAIVEVASAVAELVVGKITGAVVRGRKVQARLDAPKEDRPPRSGPPRSGGDRPARPFERDRGERPARPA